MIWKKQPVGSKLADLQSNKASKDTATQSAAGLMSASDKTKLDGIATAQSLGGIGTLSAFQSALLTVAQTIPSSRYTTVVMYTSAAFDDFDADRMYCGTLHITANSGNDLKFNIVFSNQFAECIGVGYNNGTWSIEELAFNSNLVFQPVVYTSYADVKAGILNRVANKESGVMVSIAFFANYSSSEELPTGYYTGTVYKYDVGTVTAILHDNHGIDYELAYLWGTWYFNSLNSSIKKINNLYDIVSGGYALTDIDINGGEGGKTLLVIASGHADAGDTTRSEITMIRCGYSGNHITPTLIAGNELATYGITDGKLVIYNTRGYASRMNVYVISNK